MTSIYNAEVIRMKLGASHVRLALFKILTSEDSAPFDRTVNFLLSYEMVREAGQFVEWRIKHELGTLAFAEVGF